MDEDPSNWLSQLIGRGADISRQIGFRVACLIGVIVFLIVVSVDSAGNLAAAADLNHQGNDRVNAESIAPAETASPQLASSVQPSYVNFTPQQAERLTHGDLLRANMTRSQLTRAHFFTDFLGEH
ncbi:hypothetical protein XM38_024250 [Halomicronema hongdechloris C2206]|uniref:Uncharacterized protein n=1 Tax=Halomicronema hongdechloris C2206 TaxID=1641165 RepID=A0A1Z3HME3_9CYAN|nr:hypothetical protein [Halomicronema hongdechloris]ASC71473.1 hypothetical protein XM38_024250 [Halomicronema hongdechloris C2206]